MVKYNYGKSLNTDSVQGKMSQVKSVSKANRKEGSADPGGLEFKSIPTRNAIKIAYYLMAADGQIFHNEEDKFDAIGAELDPKFAQHKLNIVWECQKQLDKVIDPEDYFDALKEGIDDALISSRKREDSFITPKLLVWDLLTIAYSDEKYDETERLLLKYIVRKLNVDKALFLELENCILTLMDLEEEVRWLKTTERPYLIIEAMLNEIADRKNVIFESVKDLISL